MRTSTTLFLLVIVMICSCTKPSEGPTNLVQTLRLTNESMRKNVDLQLNAAIWTDEQRGRNNEELIALLKQLANSRKDLDHKEMTAVKAHLSRLSALKSQIKDDLDLDLSFARVDAYLKNKDRDAQTQELLVAELTYIELTLVAHWSRQLGIVDCCFPSPINVQTNGVVKPGANHEMVFVPSGERALWDRSSYSYEDIRITQSGEQLPVEFKASRIGHTLILLFTMPKAGKYVLHVSVTETGDYLAEPWQQDFEWPVIFQ